jgi:hypothetical protein
VQRIQRTFCQDEQPSSPTYLAAMIDRRTREYGLTAGRLADISEGLSTRMQRPPASVLIWVEGGAELPPEPAACRHRGMLVVAHGSGKGPAEGSFIISYPVDADDDAPHVTAVSGVLERMGWAVLGTRRGSAAGRHVNTVALVSNGDTGSGQRLWLAETVGATKDPGSSTHAPASGSSAAQGDSDVRTQGIPVISSRRGSTRAAQATTSRHKPAEHPDLPQTG